MEAKHSVVFYEDGAERARAAACFLAAGHADGQPLVIVAVEDRLAALIAALREHGLDVDGDESVTVLGARATLDRIVVDGRVDSARFDRLVGDVMISQHAITGRPPCAYGEMIDLLWHDGNSTAALELERLWDDLLARVPLSLLCGCALDTFEEVNSDGRFRAVCCSHDQVAPVHLYERLREVEAEVLAASRDQLIALLGHELRNPLAPMLTALELVRRQPNAARECELIERQIHQMARVVDSLIDEMLPRIFDPALPPRRQRAAGGPTLCVVPDRLRVLVIDDNQDAADTLAEILGDAGHTVAVAYDGPTAIELARQHDVDVAVVDLGLPGMDGYELAPHLRELAGPRPLRLLALTGYGQDKDRRRSQAAGFDAHLIKPVSIATLLAALAV